MKVHLAYFSGICLHLFAISISADQCLDGPSGTNCSFQLSLCAWKSELWKQSSFWKAALDTDKNHTGSMESEELCSTNTDTHCLLFDYEFRYQRNNETTLLVLLHEDDTTEKTIWRLRSDAHGIYTAKLPLSTHNSFKIEFKVHRHGTSLGAGSNVWIDKIWYKSSKCELEPADADPGRKTQPTKPSTEKPKVTTTTTTAMTTTKLTKPSTMKPTPRIKRTTATTTTTTTTRASPTTTKPHSTSSRTLEQKTHSMTDSKKITSSTTSEKMSKSQQRSTSPNPLKGSGPTLSTPDSAGSSNGYIVGTAVSIFVLVVCIVVILALLRHRRKACWQRSGADKTTATNNSLHNAESHLLTDSRADGTPGVSPPNPDTNTYSVVDDEQTNSSNNGQPSSPPQPQTDVYSVVHKPDKGGQSRHPNFNNADDKSKTTDNGAAAANNEDYNTLNMRGGETMGNTTKPGSSESAGAVYSHLGSINKTAAVPAKMQPANADTSQASGNDVDAATDSGARIYHILEESEVDTTANPSKMNEQDEEYRSLDFAGRKGGAASEAVSGEGEGEQVYNRLKDGDGETYSHVKRDVKQQVVSDDTYSHIV